MSESSPFGSARWVWCGYETDQQFVVFRRVISHETSGADGVEAGAVIPLTATLTASYHYEFYVNGDFVSRGPVHGDPKWCQYDVLHHETHGPVIEIVILVHHSNNTYLHYLTPAPAGVIASIEVAGTEIATDDRWQCLELDSWSADVPQRGWAIGYCEDYDARKEPPGFESMHFADHEGAATRFEAAVELSAEAAARFGGFTQRITPPIIRERIKPERVTLFRTTGDTPDDVFDISAGHDQESLELIAGIEPYASESLDQEKRANAFLFDFGEELVGFPEIEIEAPAGTVIEISWAELLKPGEARPWVFRKGVCYSARYTADGGRRRFHPFAWSGFRYLYVVIRDPDDARDWRLFSADCIRRRVAYHAVPKPELDRELDTIYDICLRTLVCTSQEFHSDCPTREQAAAWLDGLVSTSTWLTVTGDDSYLRWYFEAFIHAPLDEFGLINGRYPGTIGRWIDMCLLPLVAHTWYRRQTGRCYRPAVLASKAELILRWYTEQTDDRGIIDFDFTSYFARGLRNFIDHPGLSMHDAEHPGIDRDGASCPLNCYYLMFLEELATLAGEACMDELAQESARCATALAPKLRSVFFDGEVFHDCEKQREGSPAERLSLGTSWQTNAIAVCAGLVSSDEAAGVMQKMLAGYEQLCRCTPGLTFFFLRALVIAGMEDEAFAYVKREWGPMIESGATTCWETFLGNEKDSLCHPWGTTPLLLVHDAL